jgi:tetratricopeptide (TPR) repeat protein
MQDTKIPFPTDDCELMHTLRRRYEAGDHVRRGVCLLNAGQFVEAETCFNEAMSLGHKGESLPTLLAACLLGRNKPKEAAVKLGESIPKDGGTPQDRIRYALALWASGRHDDAIASLREGLRQDTENSEYHFQIGVLLAAQENYEEAELRFTQALNIDRNHKDALVNLALCCGIRSAPSEALAHLQRAQSRHPEDPRLGALLAQAAKAAQHQGQEVCVRADMPNHESDTDSRGISELAQIIGAEPDFVDAFLSVHAEEVDTRVFSVLIQALSIALRVRPDHAALHHQRGRVLARVGRNHEAINENERAVELDPTFTRALIELGKLFQKTDRNSDAAMRLEQAVAAGADYADVHFLLGNLYRRQGLVSQARTAYKRALVINNKYEAAELALKTLPAI